LVLPPLVCLNNSLCVWKSDMLDLG
jgi:hypothetical protein